MIYAVSCIVFFGLCLWGMVREQLQFAQADRRVRRQDLNMAYNLAAKQGRIERCDAIRYTLRNVG